MILHTKASVIMLLCLQLLLWRVQPAAAGSNRPADHYPHMIRLEELLAFAASWAREEAGRSIGTAPLPAYAEALLADGLLSIGLGLGTKDLGRVRLPQEAHRRRIKKTMRICGRSIKVEARFILSRKAFRQALGDCEIIFVTSHSRFGAGPVFRNDGKAYPFLMQQTQGYEIRMPDEEICGYAGTVKRRFYDAGRRKSYTVFQPDSSDLESSRPLHGYQLLVLSTCISKKHFSDEIKQFRSLYPTSAILTRRAAFLDPGMNVFMRFLAQVLQGRELPDIVTAMNREYNAVVARQVRRGAKRWKQVDAMYELAINTVP